jgi:outer membrane protein assembly factor BamB
MKKISKMLSAACAAVIAVSSSVSASAEWAQFRGNDSNNGVVTSAVPTSADDTALYWATKIGSADWGMDGPAPLTMSDSYIYCAGGDTLYKIDKDTGVVSENTGTLAGYISYGGSVPPLYADGKIFIGVGSGKIQAFDADTLESLWVYTDETGGNTYTPITYSDGYIYTGFWQSETDSANYVSISVTDEDPTKTDEAKSAEWTYSSKGGFYWAGAVETDTFVAFGTDDGAGAVNWWDPAVYTDDAAIVTVDKKTGEVIDKLSGVYGDVRSSLVYDSETDRYYFTSKAGLFCSVKISDEGKISDLKTIELGGASTSTPVVAGGRAYVGVCGSDAYSAYTGSCIAVIDLDSFTVAYKAETAGYPQSSGLLKTDEDGYNYVYFVENTAPSSIRYIKDKKGVTSLIDGVATEVDGKTLTTSPTLFTPSGDQNISGYSLCSLICDEDGTLYFKNDDTYVMAVGAKVESLEVSGGRTLYKEGESFDISDFTVTATLSNGVTKDVTDRVTYSSNPLTTEDIFTVLTYDYALYCDGENGAGTTVSPVTATVDIDVLSAEDYDKVTNVINLIDAIGEVTADSGEAIEAAQTAYDALGELTEYVSNSDVLTAAVDAFAKLTDNTENVGNGDTSGDNDTDEKPEDTGISGDETSADTDETPETPENPTDEEETPADEDENPEDEEEPEDEGEAPADDDEKSDEKDENTTDDKTSDKSEEGEKSDSKSPEKTDSSSASKNDGTKSSSSSAGANTNPNTGAAKGVIGLIMAAAAAVAVRKRK